MDILIGIIFVTLTLISSVFIGKSKWFDNLMRKIGNYLSS